MPTPIGLIGLGLMGSEIAKRLIAGGVNVMGYDLDAGRCIDLVTAGGQACTDVEEIWSGCERVILSLPNDAIVRQVISPVISNAQFATGKIIIDTTTGAAEITELLAQQCAQQGVEWVDATISGSSFHLHSGQAVLLVGATEFGWNESQAVLGLLGKECFHVGPPGAGARMKLVTNLVLGLNRAALAEGLAFAKAQCLDLELTLKLLRATPAYSRIMDTKGEKMINDDFAPQAKLSQHLKDVELMIACAGQRDLSLPLSHAHRELLLMAQQLGYGEADNSALIKAYNTEPQIATPGSKHRLDRRT